MKKLITLLFVALGMAISKAQSFETQSVEINNLINFVAETYPQQNEEDLEYNKITVALQVANADLDIETRFVLKQAFKLLSDRLNDESTISIVTYYGINGLVLDEISVKDLNSINKAINNLKDFIDEENVDGITMSYQHAKITYDEDANNVVLIIRNENVAELNIAKMSEKDKKKLKRKKRNQAILTTAVGLLPELVALLNK